MSFLTMAKSHKTTPQSLHLWLNGQATGPYTIDQVSDLLAAGKAGWGTAASDDGGARWQPLDNFRAAICPPPAKPGILERWRQARMAAAKAWLCADCGYASGGCRSVRGSLAIEILLWASALAVSLVLLIFAIPYSLWRLSSRRRRCPSCGSERIIASASPRGRQIIAGQP